MFGKQNSVSMNINQHNRKTILVSSSHSSIDKIRKISHFLILSFKILMLTLPLLTIAYWFGLISLPKEYFSMFRVPVDVDITTLRFNLKLAACLIDLIPTGIVLLGFYYLIKLFELFSNQIFFGLQNVTYIRKIGFNLLLQFAASILVQPFISLILTFDAPKGGHTIAIGMGNNEISTLLIGTVVILFSWIMEEARKLEEEKSLTV